MSESHANKDKVFTSSSFNEYRTKQTTEEITHSLKDLKIQLMHQLDLAKEKDTLIQEITQENKELEEEVQDAKARLQDLQKQVEILSKFQEQEQEKTQEEKEEEMHLLNKALQIQKQAFGLFNGLSQEQIISIPVFEYEKGFTDSQICLSCFQAFEEHTNIKCLPCYHTFHQLCIDESLAVTKYCPACQTQVVVI